MKNIIIIITCSLIFLFANASFAELTVEEAYKAIPHRQTVFDANWARMPEEEKEYLVEFFQLVDRAMVERVSMLLWINTMGRKGAEAENYDEILESMAELVVPEKLQLMHNLVVDAIITQRSILEQWKEAKFKSLPKVHKNRKVHDASKMLISAYNQLMSIYNSENGHNKQAFFDYLCALDFI